VWSLWPVIYEPQRFDFLGSTFRPRLVRGRAGKRFVGFTPAASNQAGTQMRREIRRWRLHCGLRSDKTSPTWHRCSTP